MEMIPYYWPKPRQAAIWISAVCHNQHPSASIGKLPLGFQCIGSYGEYELLLLV